MTGNLLIVGHGRSGKDTAAEFLHGQGNLIYAGSTSWFLLPFMAKILNKPPQIAWDTRHNHRVRWWQEANKLRVHDPLFLVRLALKEANIVAGLRDKVEMEAAKASGLFKSILWIDRPGTPVDPTVTFSREECTDWVDNSGTLEQFQQALKQWAQVKGFLPCE